MRSTNFNKKTKKIEKTKTWESKNGRKWKRKSRSRKGYVLQWSMREEKWVWECISGGELRSGKKKKRRVEEGSS